MGWKGTLRLAHQTRAKLVRTLYLFLRWFPVPAQDKWSSALQLLRLQTRVLSQVAARKPGLQEGEDLVAETLYQTARRWANKQLLWAPSSAPKLDLVGDTCGVMVKTLNLPSRVAVTRQEVTVTTYFCPFLDDATRGGGDPIATCQRICGERLSLFKGLSDGFPFFVGYRAPLMMGQGAEVCVKELRIRSTSPRTKRRPRRRWLRHRQRVPSGI